MNTCLFCGGDHPPLTCRRLKSVEFAPPECPSALIGHVRRVELHPPEAPTVTAAVASDLWDQVVNDLRKFRDDLRSKAGRMTDAQREDLQKRIKAGPATVRVRHEPPLAIFHEPAASAEWDARDVESLLPDPAPAYQPLPDEVPVGTVLRPAGDKFREGCRRWQSVMKLAGVLADGPMVLGDLARAAGVCQPTASKALKAYGPGTDRPYFQRGPNGWGLTARGGETLLPHLAGARARGT